MKWKVYARNGLATPAVLACCALSFLLGAIITQIHVLPTSGGGMHIVGKRGSQLLETSDTPDDAVLADTVPQWSSFEELVEWSGMLSDRPPVPAGLTGHTSYVIQPFQLLSIYPRAYIFPRFLTDRQADRVVELAAKHLQPSGLAYRRGEKWDPNQDVRTSSGTFLTAASDNQGILDEIEDKIAAVTGVPKGYGEPFNVLRYELQQHYHSHLDAFPEKEYGRQPSQRIATVLLYLTDVHEGGETSFLLEGKNGTSRLTNIDYTKCDTGIKYKPRKGDALLFWDVMPDGHLDRHALHGGCPVVTGEKWVATKWYRSKCMRPDCKGDDSDLS